MHFKNIFDFFMNSPKDFSRWLALGMKQRNPKQNVDCLQWTFQKMFFFFFNKIHNNISAWNHLSIKFYISLLTKFLYTYFIVYFLFKKMYFLFERKKKPKNKCWLKCECVCVWCVPDSVDSCDSSVLTVTVIVSPFAPIFVQIDCDRVSCSISCHAIDRLHHLNSATVQV